MKRGNIIITCSRVIIELGPDGQVWLTQWQLADLFGVFTAKITSNIKAIIRSGVVNPDLKGSIEFCGKLLMPELYNMEMKSHWLSVLIPWRPVYSGSGLFAMLSQIPTECAQISLYIAVVGGNNN